MKLSLDETGFGWKCHWMNPFLDESVVDEIVFCFGWNGFDESVFGRKCFWMKVFLNESVFGWWVFFCNLDESVPNGVCPCFSFFSRFLLPLLAQHKALTLCLTPDPSLTTEACASTCPSSSTRLGLGHALGLGFVNPSVWLATWNGNLPCQSLPCVVGFLCGQRAHVDRSRFFARNAVFIFILEWSSSWLFFLLEWRSPCFFLWRESQWTLCSGVLVHSVLRSLTEVSGLFFFFSFRVSWCLLWLPARLVLCRASVLSPSTPRHAPASIDPVRFFLSVLQAPTLVPTRAQAQALALFLALTLFLAVPLSADTSTSLSLSRWPYKISRLQRTEI